MIIPQTLKSEIDQYCKANGIEDVDAFVLKLLRQGFTVEKYGATPVNVKIAKPKEPVKIEQDIVLSPASDEAPDISKIENKEQNIYGEDE